MPSSPRSPPADRAAQIGERRALHRPLRRTFTRPRLLDDVEHVGEGGIGDEATGWDKPLATTWVRSCAPTAIEEQREKRRDDAIHASDPNASLQRSSRRSSSNSRSACLIPAQNGLGRDPAIGIERVGPRLPCSRVRRWRRARRCARRLRRSVHAAAWQFRGRRVHRAAVTERARAAARRVLAAGPSAVRQVRLGSSPTVGSWSAVRPSRALARLPRDRRAQLLGPRRFAPWTFRAPFDLGRDIAGFLDHLRPVELDLGMPLLDRRGSRLRRAAAGRRGCPAPCDTNTAPAAVRPGRGECKRNVVS